MAEAGSDADQHLRVDLRCDQVILRLPARPTSPVTVRDIDLADRISTLVTGLGLRTDAGGRRRSAQDLEIAIDALDIASIRPFWKAALAYDDEGPDLGNGLVDPLGQGPAIWFQQMDRPRPQRNRIHLDISVPHDEAPRRIQQALAAGGVLRTDEGAPAFWVLADAEGNEACITTWQGRD